MGVIGVNLDKKWTGPDHGECRARANNVSLGWSPQRGPGQSPWSGVRGAKHPWSWKLSRGSGIQRKGQEAHCDTK